MNTLNSNNVIKITSDIPGSKVCILGGVHGNERCGYEAIKEITSKNLIKLKKGEITFIIANQKAIEKDIRFIEENLNRCFKEDKIKTNSYEENLAKEIMPILKKHDFSLDLHSSNTPGSEPFIICEDNAFNYIKNIPAKRVCSGFDSLHAGGSDSYMNRMNNVGICVECGYSKNKKSTDFAIKTIFNFLKTLDMIDYGQEGYVEKEFLKINILYKAKGEFKLQKQFNDFEPIMKGDLIGQDNEEKIIASKDGYILFTRNRSLTEKDRDAFILMTAQ